MREWVRGCVFVAIAILGTWVASFVDGADLKVPWHFHVGDKVHAKVHKGAHATIAKTYETWNSYRRSYLLEYDLTERSDDTLYMWQHLEKCDCEAKDG